MSMKIYSARWNELYRTALVEYFKNEETFKDATKAGDWGPEVEVTFSNEQCVYIGFSNEQVLVPSMGTELDPTRCTIIVLKRVQSRTCKILYV